MRDILITVYGKPEPGGALSRVDGGVILTAYCADVEVYRSTYYGAKAAGTTVDRMVELPLHRSEISAGCTCQVGSTVYAIDRVQFTYDDFGQSCTRLTLREDPNADR